jgi:hypothetical protein
MKVDRLQPLPDLRTHFAWPYCVTVPEHSGCYALVAYSGEVLYVGLATSSVRGRMIAHLDTPEKRRLRPTGVPFWFYYVMRPAAEVGPIERGWMNQAIMEDGAIPPLNKIYSPI